ncbi:MAG: beta strand repeat-containing protein [Streptosporangiaceae bacterium]
MAVGCAGAVLALVAAAGPALAAPSTTPTLVVSTLGNSGAGSLRAAITTANATPGMKDITFTAHGVITLQSALPSITQPVEIDGTTAPTYTSGGAPVIEVNCNDQRGLVFASGSQGSELLALSVVDARDAGVTLNANSVTLNLNYLGLTTAGAAGGNHGPGLLVNSSHNLIGLNSSGDSGVTANVISGNLDNGLELSNASHNTLVANRIGTSPDGSTAIGNHGDGLILTNGSSHNEIGGTEFTDGPTGPANDPTGDKGTVTPVFVVPPEGNQMSGNTQNGVYVADGSESNMLNGNFVGTTANGNAALGNGDNGVWIARSNDNSLIGCKFVQNPFVYYNLLSGNGLNGLRVTDSDGTTVQGNFFGAGASNSTMVPNKRDGILIDGNSSGTQVGGVIPLGNVSAGNGWNGIEVKGTASGFTTFNTFGGLFAFGGAAPNGRDGLLITATGGDQTVRTNVMSGNTGNGIELGGNASGVTVDPNIAGLNTSGKSTLPNGANGLLIDGTAHGNTIGGSLRSVIPQNTFSGNAGYGIVITGRAYQNHVLLSDIGTSLLGTTAMGNQKGGVLLSGQATKNLIGALTKPPANLISGNTGIGVTLASGTSRNLVIGNHIGLNRFGQRLPNTGRPIVNLGAGNVIRGNRTS